MEIDELYSKYSQQSLIEAFDKLKLFNDKSDYQWFPMVKKLIYNSSGENEDNKNQLLQSINYIITPYYFFEESKKEIKVSYIMKKLIKKCLNELSSASIYFLLHYIFSFLYNFLINSTKKESNISIDLNLDFDLIVFNSRDKSLEEKKYLKFLIKSLILFLFSGRSAIFSIKSENTRRNEIHLISNIEKILLCNDNFYSNYIKKQYIKLIQFKGVYTIVNPDLVKNYFWSYFSQCKEDNNANSIITELFSYLYNNDNFYFNLVIISCFYRTFYQGEYYCFEYLNISKAFSFCLIPFCNPKIQHKDLLNSMFGNYIAEQNIRKKLIEIFLVDSYQNFGILSLMSNSSLLRSYKTIFPQDKYNGNYSSVNKFNEYFFYGIFLRRVNDANSKENFMKKYIEETNSTKELNNIDIYTNYDKDYKKVYLKFQATKLGKLNSVELKEYIIILDELSNEFAQIDDEDTLIIILSIIKQLYSYNSFYPSENCINIIHNKLREIGQLVCNKAIALMCKTQKFNFSLLNFILHTHLNKDLYLSYPIEDTNFFINQSKINILSYIEIFFQYQIFFVDYHILIGDKFEQFIVSYVNSFKGFIDKVFDGLNKTIKPYWYIIQYLYLYFNLKLFQILLSHSPKVRIIYPYCMFCKKKLPKTKIYLSQFTIYCPKCESSNIIVNFKYTDYFIKNKNIIMEQKDKIVYIIESFISSHIFNMQVFLPQYYLFLDLCIQFLSIVNRKENIININEDIQKMLEHYQEKCLQEIEQCEDAVSCDDKMKKKVAKWKRESSEFYLE